MPRILLTGVVGPHSNIQFDIAGDRLTRDQDIFTVSSHTHYASLHFIAANLSSPCVVLEHPTMDELEAELAKGYDFVGINFTMMNIAKTIQMCDGIRKVAPDTKIILGGYGTSCFTTIFKGQEEILQLADHICHGEGVSYLRQLLGERIDAPIQQIVGPRGASSFPWMDPYPPGQGGAVISGLGCPNMCEFCSTSFYYGGEFIELSTADGLFDGMKRIWRCQPESHHSVAVFDENLYKDKEKVTQLGKLIREDKEFGLGKINYFSFGTIEDLSRYDVVEDLVMNGVGSIWIGVESMFTPLKKRQGRDVKEVFDELHAHGITTTGSWIGGWDFHDKVNIEEDLDFFVSLEATQTQLFPLFPPPGTALYERLVSEDRIPDLSLAKRYFGRTSGAQFGFPDWRKNFTEEEIHAVVESGHGRIYRHAGPSVMRGLRVHLNGYEFCINSDREVLREQRSQLHKAHCLQDYPLIKVCEFFAPTEEVRQKIQKIREDFHRLFGEPTIEQEVMSNYAMLKGSLYKMSTVLPDEAPSEPPYRVYEYDRRQRPETDRPYVGTYPNHDPKYEHEMSVHKREMQLVRRVIELLEQGKSLDDAGEAVRRIDEAFKNLEVIGQLAKLVDDLGDDLGLGKAWLRSEKLRALGATELDPARETVDAGQDTAQGARKTLVTP